jgi:uncharacterized protein (UPF0335 family)
MEIIMAELNELVSKYQNIQKSIEQSRDLKARLEERKKNVHKQLSTLLDKIKSQGYDPKNLKEIRDQKIQELENLVKEKEQEVKEVHEKLKAIDIETSL